MKKSSLYTGGGDGGMTSLVGGVRVPKTHQRLEAYGTIDELNSFIGLLIAEVDDLEVSDLMKFVQHKLFAVGSCLATDAERTNFKPENRITPAATLRLEQGIDLFDSKLPEMKGFILPGGNRTAALAHVSRSICRRAERRLYRLKEEILVEEEILVFINRLSDLLFVIARYECFQKNGEEIIWDNTCN